MKLRPFELALVIIFGGLALAALLILSSADFSKEQDPNAPPPVGTVTIWGTLPREGMDQVLREVSTAYPTFSEVAYRYYAPADFDNVLLNALADGTGPDLVLVSQEKLVEIRRRLQPISYETPSYSIRDIRDRYLDGAQIFALSDGLYGQPIAVDPLMMYWNRDILATEGYLDAPRTWESLVNTMFPSLIEREFDRTITRSVVAMGEYDNIRNAFGIISALLIQGGSQRITENSEGRYTVRLQVAEGGGSDPLRAAADFYTRFSKPSNALYSWNRSFSEDRQRFASEDLVFYFGYASEARQLERLNPNLNFDISEIPQGETATTRRTYGKFYALAKLRTADNVSGANAVMAYLGSPTYADKIAVASGMVPAHRATVSVGSNDTYGRVTYQSAPIAFGWLNPDLAVTDEIFKTMTEDINENRRDLSGAASDVSSRLNNEYK